MSNDASSQSGISDLIKGAVDKAYEVVDVYIKEGQEAAKHIRDGVYTNSNAETDVQNLINHWVKLVKELSVTGIEILSIIVRDTRLVPTPGRPASSPPGARGPAPQSPSAQIAVETRSKNPVQVHHQLDTKAAHFIPLVLPLYSADRTASLRGTRFVVGAGGRPVLVIDVPDQQPPGTYTGAIIDALTREERGSISVVVLQQT